MKKVMVCMMMVLLAGSINAQSDKFKQAMETNIAALDAAKSPADLQNAAASFERIANAEKTQWLPFYYAAIANIWRGFSAPNEEKDDIATQAENLLAKAEALDANNAEIYIAKNMTSTIHMIVDPQTRWQTYGGKGAQDLAMAKKLDVNNPRIYYLEGQGIIGMPVQFGGGKDKAKPLFEKSVALFDTYKPVNTLYPNWGKKNAVDMLEQCK
ncbi:MAG: hypothetical protein LH478_12935 [Chitinophagaceae bacterium]|nr:hypothetical protein [Chitinophagaceae bacterium]